MSNEHDTTITKKRERLRCIDHWPDGVPTIFQRMIGDRQFGKKKGSITVTDQLRDQ
jgi:hypothetical protein